MTLVAGVSEAALSTQNVMTSSVSGPVDPICPYFGVTSSDPALYKCLVISRDQKSWRDALGVCEGYGGTLAKIESQVQQDYIRLHQSNNDYHWFGMHDMVTENDFYWTDGLPVTWLNWSPTSSQPNGGSNQNCTAIDGIYMWQDKECKDEYYYVCQVDTTVQQAIEVSASNIMTSSVTPPDTPYCPFHGVTSSDPALYKCLVVETMEVSWRDALGVCERYGGTLAKIENEAQQDYVSSLESNNPYHWFGMHDLGTDNYFYWTDGFPVTWLNWRTGQPDGGTSQNCLAFDSSSEWQDKDCDELYPFVCQVDTDARKAIEVSPPNIMTPSVTPPGPLYCPYSGVTSSDPTLYKCLVISSTKKTWRDALGVCEGYGGTLAKIESQAQQDYIRLHQSNNQNHWFGMHDLVTENDFYWTDGLPVTWFNWEASSSQPNGGSGQNCTAIDNVYMWQDKECETKYYFVCQVDSNVKQANVGTYCPPGGYLATDDGLYSCLVISEDRLSWPDALDVCERQGGTLAIIQNQDQQDYIQKNQRNNDYHWFGMNDIAKEGEFVFTDSSPVTWFNWEREQPNGWDSQQCTAINDVYEWEDKECENLYHYVCQIVASGPPVDNVFDPGSVALQDKTAKLARPSNFSDYELLSTLGADDESICVLYCLYNPQCKVVGYAHGKSKGDCFLYKTFTGGFAPLWVDWNLYEVQGST